jgi:hypothetical protein
MSFQATVIPVMIASPGDVHAIRTSARDVIHEWNYIHSDSTHLVLMPVGWETHSSPELGSSAQDLINERVLEDCDLLIGIFWTRLGTPTGRASSGTVEEIQRHVDSGKPAMIYFSKQPAAPDTIDPDQYRALVQFRSWCETQGLVETFFGAEDFATKLKRHIQIVIQKNDHLRSIINSMAMAADKATGSAIQQGAEDMAPDTPTLSPEARELLVAAAKDTQGTILTVDALAGRIITAGQQHFGNPENRREMAKWDYGLDQLLTLGLVDEMQASGNSTRIFQLTAIGYQIADQITGS